MRQRSADAADLPLLAAWNRELIQDERADTALDLAQLEARMRAWLAASYRAVIFETGDGPIGCCCARCFRAAHV